VAEVEQGAADRGQFDARAHRRRGGGRKSIMSKNIFEKIIAREIRRTLFMRTRRCWRPRRQSPSAKRCPDRSKKEHARLSEAGVEDEKLLGHLLLRRRGGPAIG